MASKWRRDTIITDHSLLELFRKKTARSPAVEKESSSSSHSVEQSLDYVKWDSYDSADCQRIVETTSSSVSSAFNRHSLVPLALEQRLQFWK